MKSTMKLPLGLIASLALLTTSCTTMAETPGANINEQRSIKPVTNANKRTYKVVTNQNSQTDRLANLI